MSVDWRQFVVPTLAAGVAGLAVWAFARRPRVLERYRRGVFIEYSLFGDPAQELRRAGMDFIILQTAVQKPNKPEFIWRDSAEVKRVAARVNPDGSAPLAIWLWGWPTPARYKEYVEHVDEVLNNSGDLVSGYVLNIEEKAWSTRDTNVDLEGVAADFVDRLRDVTDKPLFLSSHGRADLTRIPWRALSKLDGGMPQVYDKDNKYGDRFITKCIQSYREAGFKKVWPTLGATRTSPARMQEQLGTVPCVEALTWWSWTTIGRNDERKIITAGSEPCPTVAV